MFIIRRALFIYFNDRLMTGLFARKNTTSQWADAYWSQLNMFILYMSGNSQTCLGCKEWAGTKRFRSTGQQLERKAPTFHYSVAQQPIDNWLLCSPIQFTFIYICYYLQPDFQNRFLGWSGGRNRRSSSGRTAPPRHRPWKVRLGNEEWLGSSLRMDMIVIYLNIFTNIM